jgi:hypothetical protein
MNELFRFVDDGPGTGSGRFEQSGRSHFAARLQPVDLSEI